MDLSEIVNIQDRLLENKADLLFNYELRSFVPPNTMSRQKTRTSLLSNHKIRMKEKKKKA